MKLSEIGEFGLIGRIAGRIPRHDGVMVGIGDDAAATTPTPHNVTLTTSDMLVEGVHFDLQFSDFHSLGRKALSVNLSDIAAMGGKPRSCLLSLAIPPSLQVEALDAFVNGLLEVAETFDVVLIGGDTCSSRDGFVISITAMGEQLPELVVRRDGARPGDLVCVTGTLGQAALGLELLRSGKRDGPAVARQLDPLPRVQEGRLVAEARLATAMIDVSDGFVADLGHILGQSRVGATVYVDRVPLAAGFDTECRQAGLDPVELALSGGEDYELVFTIPPDAGPAVKELFAPTGVPVVVVGEITDGRKLNVIGADGAHYPLRSQGYNHFNTK